MKSMALYDLDNRTREFGVARRWRDAFGRWRTEAKHKGDDYAETYGNDPVPAIQPGKVIAKGKSSIFGFYLHVRRDSRTVVRYHMFQSLPALLFGADVEPGDILGRTGASAANANGNHIHIQVEVDGVPVDPRPYIARTTPAGNGSTTIGDDDMSAAAENDIKNIHAMLSTGASILIDGKVQKFNYGVLPIVAHNQTLLARQAGQIAALSSAVSQIKGGTPLDMEAIEEAAEKGAREAFEGLTFTAHG